MNPFDDLINEVRRQAPRPSSTASNPFQDLMDEIKPASTSTNSKTVIEPVGAPIAAAPAPVLSTPVQPPVIPEIVQREPTIAAPIKEVAAEPGAMDYMNDWIRGEIEGVKGFGRKIDLLVRDIGASLGIIDKNNPEERRKEIADLEADAASKAKTKAYEIAKTGTGLAVELSALAPIGGAAGAVAKAGSKLATSLKSGLAGDILAGSAFGALQDPGAEGSRLTDTAKGALLGGAAGTLFRGIGAITGRNAAQRGASENLRQIPDKLKDVPLSVGQVRDSRTLKAATRGLEAVPLVGTSKFYLQQFQAIKQHADDWLASLRPKDLASADVDDIGTTLLTSIQNKLGKVNRIEANLYDRVGRLTSGIEKASPDNMMAAIKKGIDEIDSVPAGFLDDAATKFRSTLEAMSQNKSLSFSELHRARQSIDDMLFKSNRGTAAGSASKAEVRILSRIRAAMEDDLAKLVELGGPRAKNAYTKAKQFYIDNKLPFNDSSMQKFLDGKLDVESILAKFVKPDAPSKAKLLVQSLDKEGRQALEFGVVDRAMRKAMDPNKGFRADVFNKELNKLGKTAEIVFSKATKEMSDGLQKLIHITETTLEQPSVLQKVIAGSGGVGLSAAGAFISPGAAISAGTLIATFSKLMTTDVGRKLLTKVNKLPENSIAMRGILRRLLTGVLEDQSESE